MISSVLEQQTRDSIARQPLLRLYGAEVQSLESGYIEIKVPVKDFMLRTAGIVNGGVLAALADSAAGYALSTLDEQLPYLLTIEFKINFLVAAKGDTILATGRVLKNGGTLGVAQADLFMLYEGNRTLAATALVTLIKRQNHGSSNS